LIKNKLIAITLILFLLPSFALIGCSGGGGDESPAPKPIIQALPSSYNFGAVTPGNSPEPLEVKIANNGSASLKVSDITLSDINNFDLNLNGGSNPCNTASPTIDAGNNCTVEVDFTPQSMALFDSNLTLRSNDPANPTLDIPLGGTNEEINELNVRINQVETNCPGIFFTVYASVTDQGGYPVTTLTDNDFTVTETGGYVGVPTSASFASSGATISVALVMDYSSSVTSRPNVLDNMETAAATLVNYLGANDEAEIVKFGPDVEVVQEFTSDIAALTTAINAPWDHGQGTNLYTAAWQAIDDTKDRLKNRRAVIVITDGVSDPSSYDLADVISYANENGIPIFTIAMGDEADIDALRQMADNTGGQLYEAATPENLNNIYQQLANILFYDQYILTYNSGLGAGATANLTIKATLNAIEGDDTKEITACP